MLRYGSFSGKYAAQIKEANCRDGNAQMQQSGGMFFGSYSGVTPTFTVATKNNVTADKEVRETPTPRLAVNNLQSCVPSPTR